jgi:hypothetical protein
VIKLTTGPSISFGLAQAGASNFLKLYNKDKDAFTLKSSTIHSFMVNELRTNDSGFMKRKNPERARKLDAKLPADVFPGASLEAYLRPARSPEDPALGWPGFGKGEASEIRGMGRNHGRWDLESCARTCERFFEWATIEAVCKKFSGDNGIFTSQIMHEARSRVLEADKRRGRPKASFSRPSLGSEPTERVTPFFSDAEIRRASLPALDDSVPEHILKITSSRPSPMCDQMTELRVSFNPRTYLERATAAMDGTREEMTAERRAELGLVEHPERPESSQRSETEASERAESPVAETVAKHEIRTWVPDYLIRSAWPSVADEHDAAMAAKAAAKATPKKKRAPKAKGVTTEDAQAFKSYFTQPARGASPTSSIAESMGSLALSLSPTSSRRRQKTSSTASATETLEPSATPTPTRARKKTLSKASSTPSPSTSLTAVESPATPIVRRRKGARKIVPVTPESSPTAEVAEAPTAVNTPVPLRRSTRKSRPAMDATATPEEIICSATPSPSPTPVRMSRKKASKEPSPLVAHDKRTHTDVSSSSAASRGTTPRRRSPKKAATVDIRGSSDAPIDLCDSDNDEPPRRASPCRSSPRKTKSKSKTATPPVLQTASLNLPTDETSAGTKSTSKPALQSTLESLIVARARKTAAKPAAPGPETPPPKRKPKYIVSVDADGVEHIYIRGKPPS